jgi:hypothetical protein
MTAFAYPTSAHRRKHAPGGYADYESYRPWLRDEFSFRCVFCLIREVWVPTQTWHIDHLHPRVKFASRICDYNNLLYLCPRCNGNKNAKLIPDPCGVALGRCLKVAEDGKILALNKKGRRIIQALRLDNDAYNTMRGRLLNILRACELHDPILFRTLMGYPKNLPNLAAQRPPKNRKPEGIKNCHFELHLRSELPPTY